MTDKTRIKHTIIDTNYGHTFLITHDAIVYRSRYFTGTRLERIAFCYDIQEAVEVVERLVKDRIM